MLKIDKAMESARRRTRTGNASSTSIDLPTDGDKFNDALKLMGKTNEAIVGKHVGSESETHVCLTAADCGAQARLEGLQFQLLIVDGPKLSKGCFRKEDRSVAYWGSGSKEVIEEVVPSSNESVHTSTDDDAVISAKSGESPEDDTEYEVVIEEEQSMIEKEEQSMIEIDAITLDGVEEENFQESFEAIPQEKEGGYKSKMVISSIVVASVVFLAFVVLFVARVKNKRRRRRGEEDSTDRHWITSSSSEVTPVASNTTSSKLTRSIPTGLAQFTIDEE
ncbi:hypothetical protein THAOC_12514 [Thalassiosira oceanica]|uniref:Uncharacterized protein n=1 Tax=Thalassiosira oceanica TaxID=159749 RepID=K0T7X4_THAOC|nr:hypothetical protein THAOC_12514 [Thalassiosira oceanica]|eukprot:EJK66562.1 hypothetical protein THAOC_12514 [Thalassiosira oceanica]